MHLIFEPILLRRKFWGITLRRNEARTAFEYTLNPHAQSVIEKNEPVFELFKLSELIDGCSCHSRCFASELFFLALHDT